MDLQRTDFWEFLPGGVARATEICQKSPTTISTTQNDHRSDHLECLPVVLSLEGWQGQWRVCRGRFRRFQICRIIETTHLSTENYDLWVRHLWVSPTCAAPSLRIRCNRHQHTATHCNTLQHSATHLRPLKLVFVSFTDLRSAITANKVQQTSTHCNTPQHTATHCNT